MKIAYITDIHIEFIYKNIKPHPTFDMLVDLFADELNSKNTDIAVIAGDICHCRFDTIQFLEAVDKKINIPCYYVLGNHDLWDYPSSLPLKFRTYDDDNVYGMLNRSNLLYIMQYFKSYNNVFKNIKLLDTGDIHDIGNGYKIIGSLGYSGNNFEFGPLQRIYRDTIRDLNLDIQLTKDWLKWVQKCIKKHEKLIVLTHTPITDWNYGNKINLLEIMSKDVYFINGHTHGDLGYFTTKKYKDDAQNGYFKTNFEFRILEVE